MNEHAHRIRRYVASDEVPARNPITELFADRPQDEAIEILIEAARDYSPDTLGYVVFPALNRHLRTDDALFQRMLHVATRADVPDAFRIVLLDYLDHAARSRTERGPYWQTMRALTTDPRQSPAVRVQAARSLAHDTSPETLQAVQALLGSDDPRIVDVSAQVVRRWGKNKVAVPPTIADALATYAEARPKNALRSSGVLGALAQLRSPRARQALKTVARASETDHERAALLSAAGAALEPADLAAQINTLVDAVHPQAEVIIQSQVVTNPSRLKVLHEGKHHQAYLYAAGLAHEAGSELDVNVLRQLSQSSDAQVALRAQGLVERATAGKSSAPRPRDQTRAMSTGPQTADEVFAVVREAHLERVASDPVPNGLPLQTRAMMEPALPDDPIDPGGGGSTTPQPTSWPLPAYPSYSTGFHLGDALYSDLWDMVVAQNHWHSGLFLGFKPFTNGNAELRGVQATSKVEDTMQFFSAYRSFSDPAGNVAATMQALRDSFVATFKTEQNYNGARRAPGMTPAQRDRIVSTGSLLVGQGIWYTWAAQLDNTWWTWEGLVDHIDRIRCDGVVEYCYERNGVRVCGGKNAALWNIAASGLQYIDNHEDFHDHAWELGELCPRIQAGNEGHGTDSRFSVQPTYPPTVADFTVYGASAPNVPSLWFRVLTDAYTSAYLRLTVSKQGGPYYFVRTENPYGTYGMLTGDWQFRTVNANTARVGAWWAGKTVNGPDFRGQNGTYNFRAVAVDRGGNVSDVRSVVVEVRWP